MDSKEFRSSLNVTSATREKIRREITEEKKIAEKLYPQVIKVVLDKIQNYGILQEEKRNIITVPYLKDKLGITSSVACQVHQILKNNKVIDSYDGEIAITENEAIKIMNQINGINQEVETR